MVARDDLSDGGAQHLVNVITALRQDVPDVTVEVLTSDFSGNTSAWDLVIAAKPDIFNHNIETVRELTPRVRHKATYERTLTHLSYVKKVKPEMLVKSGLMVGLGESEDQVHQTLRDLCEAGCDIVTMGQYLQPNRQKLRVKDFISPEIFAAYEKFGYSIGIKNMYCGPFVRSSYNANLVIQKANGISETINSH
jgi:lipoic acid synthetase